MARLAERTRRIATSPTMKVTAAVDRLRREGVDVIDFGAGEPDFPTPRPIGAAGRDAIEHDVTKYTPVAGTADLRRAICARYRQDYGVEYSEAEVIVTAGGKQALFNTALALFGPGDEVIIHAPCWPTLAEQVKLAEATPVLVQTDVAEGFAIRASRVLDAVTLRTRGILINSPCNPTGSVIAQDDLIQIAREAARRDIWVVVDLCYEKLIYESTPHNIPAILEAQCPGLGVICGSASKAYAMTGWRGGWTIAPREVVAAQAAIQSHATSNVSSITQQAMVAALTGSQTPVWEMLEEYRRRRDRLCAWLAAEPRLAFAPPSGAFYLFVDVRRLLGDDESSAQFAEMLLEERRVAVTPGEAFAAPGFIRISFATSMTLLEEGSRRLLEFCAARPVRSRVR